MAKKTKTKSKKAPQEQEFDINAFVNEQELEMDPSLLDLMEPTTKVAMNALSETVKKGKKKHMKAPKEEEKLEEVEQDPEEEKELLLYQQMMAEKEGEEDEDEDDELNVVEFKNQTQALLSRLSDFKMDLKFEETLSVTVPREKSMPASVTEIDPNDDLNRELFFYNQALFAATEARKKCKAAGIPFTRPSDYFAEMLKSDEQMHKIRQEMTNQHEEITKKEQAKKQRELKKYGKKVQIEKTLERQKAKKDDLEKVKIWRKQHKGEEFDVDQLDNNKDSKKRPREKDDFDVETTHDKAQDKKPAFNRKRVKKDQKYGFGGGKKFAKSNTRDSTDDLSGFSSKKMKAKAFKSAKGKKGKSR